MGSKPGDVEYLHAQHTCNRQGNKYRLTGYKDEYGKEWGDRQGNKYRLTGDTDEYGKEWGDNSHLITSYEK